MEFACSHWISLYSSNVQAKGGKSHSTSQHCYFPRKKSFPSTTYHPQHFSAWIPFSAFFISIIHLQLREKKAAVSTCLIDSLITRKPRIFRKEPRHINSRSILFAQAKENGHKIRLFCPRPLSPPKCLRASQLSWNTPFEISYNLCNPHLISQYSAVSVYLTA